MKFEKKIRKLFKLTEYIISHHKEIGKYTYWYTYIGSEKDEFESTKIGLKPMVLLWDNNGKSDRFIKEAKNICKKDKGFSCGYIGSSKIHFIFGTPSHVFIGQRLLSHWAEEVPLVYDVLLGLLLGYPIPNIASFLNRLSIMFSEFDEKSIYPQPQRSRNPIQDVLDDKKEFVLIPFPTRGHTEVEKINPIISQLNGIIEKDKYLDFCVCYRNNTEGTPYIVFGDKRLVDAYWEQIP